MVNKTPLVTVITPSYMQGKYIEDTILSVFHQRYKNIEHIILDACSTDETDEIVKKYLRKYNLKYIRETDNGQANAINKGLDLAKGEIVCWLNSDDFFFDDFVIEKVVMIFNSRPNIDLVTGDGYQVDEKLNLICPFNIQKIEYKFYNYMKVFNGFLQPSTFWRNNDIRLDERFTYTFDWLYFLEYFKQKKSILYVRDYLSCFTAHDGGKSLSNTAIRKKEIFEVVKLNDASLSLLIWNFFVYFCYITSEKYHLPVLKKLASRFNTLMGKFTNMKIYSC